MKSFWQRIFPSFTIYEPVNDFKLLHPATIPYPICRLDPEGINNVVNAVSLNAKFPSLVNAAPFPLQTTEERSVHFSKALSPITEMLEGSVIDFNDEQL